MGLESREREEGQVKKGRAPEQYRSTEPQEGRGDEGKTNGGSGAGWGAVAGGGRNLKNRGCALDPISYFGFPVAELLHVWGSYRRHTCAHTALVSTANGKAVPLPQIPKKEIVFQFRNLVIFLP